MRLLKARGTVATALMVVVVATAGLFGCATLPGSGRFPSPLADGKNSHAPSHNARDRTARAPAASVLGPGLRFRAIVRTSPPERIYVITIAHWAPVRPVIVRTGSKDAPFATVSSAVGRLHALAGVNGYFTGPIGESPMLVRSGRVVAPRCGPRFCVKDPRTGFGLTRRGSELLVTADGRQPGRAAGLTLREFASLMRSLGAIWAIDLDGGASTVMVVRGHVANTPSDPTGERRVLTALVLLSSPQPDLRSLLGQLRALDRRICPPSPDPVAGSIDAKPPPP